MLALAGKLVWHCWAFLRNTYRHYFDGLFVWYDISSFHNGHVFNFGFSKMEMVMEILIVESQRNGQGLEVQQENSTMGKKNKLTNNK